MIRAGQPETPPQVLARARAEFSKRFGREPRFAASAPGRVNLIGEHTDYTGGFVLPIAIDRVCVAVGGAAADSAVSRLATADLGQDAEIDLRTGIEAAAEAGPNRVARGSWPSYIAGVASEFFEATSGLGIAPQNIDLLVASSVPVGSGLSSSASLEVAVATLLEAATGVKLEAAAKALLCQRAEHRYAGVPCGIMDQFISVMGREGHALLIDCRSRAATLVPMPPPSETVVVVMDTGVRHALASGEYAQRRAACAEAEAVLGRPLRDATPEQVAAAFDPANPLRPIARHVVSENARTLEAAATLRAGDLPRFGRLMNQSHDSLRDDYRVSCAELDALVDAARAIPGVFGARMTGGGFGGCAIAVCKPDAARTLLSQVTDLARQERAQGTSAFLSIASTGARELAINPPGAASSSS
jgi:galactokinase